MAEVTLDGTLERITFRNPDNGYTVARLASRASGEVTIVGNLIGIEEGMPVRVSGEWVEDRKWGRQFKVSVCVPDSPKTVVGIEKFLGSKLFPGIGPALAKRIVEKFGRETLEVISQTPARLTEVIGIGTARAKTLAAAIAEQKHAQELMVFLFGLGVSPAFAARIVRKYGKDAVDVVRSNPYRLAQDVWGIGFRTADSIAEKLGIARDAPERLEAGLLFGLETAVEDGNVHFPDEELFARTAELLAQPADLLAKPAEALGPRLGALEQRGMVVREVLGHRGSCSSLPALYQAESESAAMLAELAKSPARSFALDVAAAIAAFENVTGLELARQQRQAVEAALRDRCVVITGGPGVGKTTIVKAIVHLARLGHRKVALAAPTGRAAKRLGEATGAEAMTIHRLLEYAPHEGGFQRGREEPLEADVLVVDEASMVDAVLFHAVLSALRPGAQLVLVGDVDQLPSVGAGQVLADVIESGAATVIRLTEIFRQAAASKIVVSAHKINHGELPDLDRAGDSDFYFIQREDPEAARATIVEMVAERIPARFGFDPVTDVQVLTPMHRGELGTSAINRALQERLNPTGAELVRGERTFRRGDKVMQLKNDYDKNVFNGDIGVIEALEVESGRISVDFDGRGASYERNELDQLVHAYAVSVHKSQGSEYPAVVLSIGTQHFMMLQRSLLYTAVTRGKKLVVLVGSRRAIAQAVKNADARRRYTWLAERVKTALAHA